MSPNKTLAAQLYGEFKAFFPENAVEYFVSYYDYYQPEAYIPQSDTYIEKDALINDEIDRMRHSTTKSLFERRDVVIVASVSCIYGLGSPESYHGMHLALAEGEERERDDILRQLVALQYERNDYDFHRGTFRVRGDVVEIFPVAAESVALRVELFGDTIEAIHRIDPLKGQMLERIDRAAVYPASHYVTPAEELERAAESIKAELAERLTYFRAHNRLLEAQRLEQRTLFDLEMLREIGYCHGIENYSRHLAGRRAGETPATLIDYLPKDTLVVIDESHVGVPQLRGMLPRRPVPEGGARRVRVPAALGVRQPAAHLRRVHRGGGPGALRLGHARRRTSSRSPDERRRRADHPADRAHRPRHHGPPRRRAGRRPHGGDPRAGRARTSACWSRRSPSGWRRISASTTSRWGSACGTSTPTSTPSSASR